MIILVPVGFLVALVFKPGDQVSDLLEKQDSPVPSTTASSSPILSSVNDKITLKLRVIDDDEKRLKNVEVTVWISGSQRQDYLTNTNGYVEFQVPLNSSQVKLSLQKDGYEPIKGKSIDVNDYAKTIQELTLTKKAVPASPSPSVAPPQSSPVPSQFSPVPPQPSPITSQPSPVPSQPSPIPSQPSPVPSQSPSPQPLPSPSPNKADTQLDISRLEGFKIEIFFLSGRQDLDNVALSIKNKLSGYGLTNVRLRPSGTNTFRSDLGGCHWPNIRYDPGEESAASKLKFIVEKVVPNKTWYLLTLNQGYSDRTDNYISIFLEDEDTFNAIYYKYGIYNMDRIKSTQCNNNRRW